MPKELFYGVKDKLKAVEYAWWPPKEFKNQSAIGRFDLYPEEYTQWTRAQIINYVESH